MTEITPKVTRKDIERDLDDVISYSADMLSKLSMRDFKANWAPRLFNTDKAVQDQALDDWERLVAFGRNKPVFLFDDNRVINWVFPPILGEFQPKYSGSPGSLFSIGMEIRTIMNRLNSQGEVISERIYASRGLESSQVEYWQYKLHEIRVHCGYPYPGKTAAPTLANDSTPTSSTLTQPEDYDF